MSRPRNAARLPFVNGRPLTAAQAARLQAVSRAEASGQTTRARTLAGALADDLAAARDEVWLREALAETRALEAARGVRLERTAAGLRLNGRDGLEMLRTSGRLGPVQEAAGLTYRRRFEAAQPRQASSLAVAPGGGGRGAAEAVALRLARARREVARMEAAVAARYAGPGCAASAADALMVLREVAGQGRSIRSLAASGARRDRLTRRLGEALETLAAIAGGVGAQDR